MAYSISKEAQQLLCEIINQISLTERRAEQIRIQLCRKTSFNPYASFKRLDLMNTNQIKPEQVVQLLKENDFFVQELNTLFNKTFLKEFLNYQDFLNLILPKTDSELREITAMKQPTKSAVEKQIDYTLAQLFNLEYNEAINLERLKTRLSNQYNADQMFQSLDSLNNNILNFKDFDRFFRRNGLLLYEEELIAFFYRIDLQRTGQITLNEFRRMLEPLQRSEQPISTNTLQTPKQTISQPKFSSTFKDQVGSGNKAGQIVQTRTFSASNKKKFQSTRRTSSITESLQTTKLTENFLNDEQRFIDLGLEVLKLEMYLEEIRLKLQQQKDFNTMDFFHFMDLKNKGKVNQHEFAYFLEQIQLKNIDVIDLFNYLDTDLDGFIRYSDVSEFISPSNISSTYICKKPAKNSHLSYSISQLFSKTTIVLIQLLFNQWNANEKIIRQKKKQFLNEQSLYQIFNKLDQYKKGKFNRQDLQRFFDLYNVKDDIKLLYKRLGKLNKEINYKEFELFFIN
ncbi:unnamed protein product (macronuclear) [Paramecium tetraurelia]|uniref:EF-hand domain-containing protein n=1 Tax=Paramecium tetraurelia TaxID=5888 RepID=A0BGR9_PARTE|nr:uncharacterized protein GSPATT00028771001 [Paramecium tetraurelia]CAK57736.1 unnamed protein product [Paramecium tetraurelia]|eukprot:XP_001425134.1 hypothetical protein (macronuclear) [Paramecium tetraurelia strain d4-2]